MTYEFDVDIPKFPTKKNSLVICLNKATGRRFLQPSSEAKAVLETIAWAAKAAIPQILEGDLRLSIGVYGKRRDIDNVACTVFDGLELSGKIKNDRQVVDLRVKRMDPELFTRTTGCTILVEEV